jgi:hypothetical protein
MKVRTGHPARESAGGDVGGGGRNCGVVSFRNSRGVSLAPGTQVSTLMDPQLCVGERVRLGV